MIANRQEYEVALRQLRSLEQALYVLREELKDAGPALQAAAPGAYEQRIATLQEEVAAYLYRHPADLALLTRDPEQTLARTP